MAKRRIDGARILITGASQGIGRALAEAAARAAPRLSPSRDPKASLRSWQARSTPREEAW